MLTFNALQGIPGNAYILLALLAAICILLVALLLYLLRNNKRAAANTTGSNENSSVDDYVHKVAQQSSQKLWYQQSLEGQAHEALGSVTQLPLPQVIYAQPPAPEHIEQSNNSSGGQQVQQVLSSEGHCPLCGKVVQPNDMFCMNCGNRLKITSPQLASGKRPAMRSSRPLGADGASSAVFNEWSSATLQEKTLHDPNVISEKLTNGTEMAGRLILRSGNKNLRDYPLDRPQTLIGRSTNNTIMISKDKLTSRHHAIIRYEDGRYLLLDDHSANGTYLNGRKIVTVSTHPLYDGDVIKIGVNEFLFRIVDLQSLDIDEVPTLAVEPVISEKDIKRASVEDPLQRMITDIHAPLAESYASPVTPAAPPASDASVAIPSQPMVFTAFHPKDSPINIWNTLLVYAHQEATNEAIYQDADRFRQELEDIPAGLSSPLAQPLLPATNITIVPECKGVVFNPRRLSFKWTDNWHRSMFRFSIKKEMQGMDAIGRINIFAGPLLIATLKMSMMFTAQVQIEQVGGAEATARPYKHVFASYSKEDTAIVQAYRDVSRLLGIDVQQREALRAREIVNDALKQAIEEAEVFQLFWSSHAAQSAYISQEWNYALKLQRSEEFLRPVYWDVPLVALPEQLTARQITYLPSYTFHK